MATILLLDDDAVLRTLLAELLAEEGHTVIEGSDGLAAYDLEKLCRADLMITDLFMPGIDGMEAIINARRDRPDLKIIAMSGGAEHLRGDFLGHTREFGATAIIAKPFRPAEFLACIRSVLAIPAFEGNRPRDTKIAC